MSLWDSAILSLLHYCPLLQHPSPVTLVLLFEEEERWDYFRSELLLPHPDEQEVPTESPDLLFLWIPLQNWNWSLSSKKMLSLSSPLEDGPLSTWAKISADGRIYSHCVELWTVNPGTDSGISLLYFLLTIPD